MVASIVFLVLIVVSFAVSLLAVAVGLVSEGNQTVLETTIFSTIVFAAFFLVFVAFAKREVTSSRLQDVGDQDEARVTSKGHAKITFKDYVDHYNIKKPSTSGVLIITLLGLVYIVTFIMAQTGVIDFFKLLGYDGSMNQLTINNFGQYLMLVWALAVLPAIVEELLFRGVIFHGFLKYGKVAAVIASSVLFSLMHLSPSQTFAQFAFGIILALVYLGTKNLVYPIILHFVNNFTIVTILYASQGALDETFVYTAQNVLMMLLLLGLGVLVIWNLIKILTKKQDWTKETGQGFGTEKKKFFSQENAAFPAALMVGILIWIFVFIS